MIEINSTVKGKIDARMIRRVANAFLKKYKKRKYDVSIAIVSDARMRRLNKIYRGIDKPTDVLTFADYGSGHWPGETPNLGEVVLDYQAIKRQAKSYGKTVRGEMAFILVHGLLHLIGHDDDTEKKRLKMIEMGDLFLKSLNKF